MPSDTDSIRAQVVSSLTDKEYRDALVQESINQGIAFQIRAMRSDREWTQGMLGQRTRKPQSEISRLEDPDYEGYTLRTLCKLASAFDVAVSVRFIPFSQIVDDMTTRAPRSFSVASFADDTGLQPRQKPQLGAQTSFLDSMSTVQQAIPLANVVSISSYRNKATSASQISNSSYEEAYR